MDGLMGYPEMLQTIEKTDNFIGWIWENNSIIGCHYKSEKKSLSRDDV